MAPAIARLHQTLTQVLAGTTSDTLMYQAKQQGKNQLCREVRPA